MKRFLVLLFFVPLLSLAQRDADEGVVPTATAYGYVNGVRLDSINAVYAQADIDPGTRIMAGNFIKRFVFNYGQKGVPDRNMRITDRDGKPFLFSNTAEALNFFEFNGWNFVLVNVTPYQILLRKQGRP